MRKINKEMIEKALTIGAITTVTVILKEILSGESGQEFVTVDLNKIVNKEFE